ncbi:hypothetical protein ACW2QC_19800 [Virgibacillus sp. FSP13]
MDNNTEKNSPVIEVIFNEKKYSITKNIIALFYIALISYSQFTNKDVFGFTLVFIVTIVGNIYFICKLSFYNTNREIKDIVLLIIFVILLFWGIYTFYTVF